VVLAVATLMASTVSTLAEYCGHGGDRPSCEPLNVYEVADFVPTITNQAAKDASDSCYITTTNYTTGWSKCQFLKLYKNDIITFSSGGIYQYADDIYYAAGGGGGDGYGHSQGIGGEDFFAMRNSNNTEVAAFDFYELKGGRYTFGYYDCSKILQGGATDDMAAHYHCSEGIDLFKGCNETCWGKMEDMREFDFESSMFGAESETSTSQVFY